MRKKRSDMPSKKKILQYWHKRLLDHNREIENKKTCFACLREGSVQRCHINALCEGGSNKADNLHLLCPNCHTESELYQKKLYWLWFKNKDIVFMPHYRNIERANLAIKFAELIKKEMPDKYEQALKGNHAQDFLKLYDDVLEGQEVIVKEETQKKLF